MQMRKEPSVEFQLEGLIDNDNSPKKERLAPQSAEENQFREADFPNDGSAELTVKLQRTLKSQYLILQHEQKRKQDNVKLIEVCTRKAVEKWLACRCAGEEGRQALLLNDKDLQDIQPTFSTDLEKYRGGLCRLFQQLVRGGDLPRLLLMAKGEQPPNFVDNLSNFLPNYRSVVEQLIRKDVQDASRIDAIFQSKASLSSKFLDGLYQRFECQIFSQKVLERGLDKLVAIRSELNVDFGREYERLKELIGERPALKQFVYGGDTNQATDIQLTSEMEGLFGPYQDSQLQHIIEAVRLTELEPDNKKGLIQEFKKKLEAEEDYINFRIGMLTLKSVSLSRRAIESIATCFIEDILESIDAYPPAVRHIVMLYDKLCREKFPDFTDEDSKDFLVKTVFSKWLSTDLMRSYCARSELSPPATNANFSLVCLVLQKLLYGKQFYEREFYSCFNELIAHHSANVAKFVKEFGKELQQPQESPIKLLVMSLQSVKILLRLFKDNIPMFPEYEPYLAMEALLNKPSYQMGNSKYAIKDLYVQYVEVGTPALNRVFMPKDKLRRILIQFLLAIPDVIDSVPIYTLLERHKYGADLGPTSKVPVELYANYLQTLIRPEISLEPLVNSIYEQLEEVKRQERSSRVIVETTKGYYDSLEKTFVALTNERTSWLLTKRIDELIKSTKIRSRLILKRGEFVKLESNKESEFKKSDKSVQIFEGENVADFLKYLTDIYLSEKMHEKEQPFTYQSSQSSVKHVYREFVEVLTEVLDKPLRELKGEPKEAKSKRVVNLLGAMLHSKYSQSQDRLKLTRLRTTDDMAFHSQLQRLRFVTMKHLEDRYQLEEPLFTEVAMLFPNKLLNPQSPEAILSALHELNLIFQQVILSTGKASDITADIQIPLVQLTLIRSQVPNVKSLLRYLDTFAMEETMGSVLGQTLTLLHGSVVLLEHMTGQKLGLPEEDFQRLMTA